LNKTAQGEYWALGLDPSINHGALVMACWDLPAGTLVKYKVLHAWHTPSRRTRRNRSKGEGRMDQRLRVQKVALEVIKAVEGYQGHIVGIDWDQTSIFWGNRRAGALMTYMMGYMIHGLETKGTVPIIIPPSTMREALGLEKKASKEEVWSVIDSLPEDHGQSGDVADALVLSFMVAAGQHRVEADRYAS